MAPSSPPSRPPTGAARKRPWFLVAAIVGAWIFGAGAMTDGCNNIGFYKADRGEVTRTVQDLAKEADRDAVATIAERYFGAMDAARGRVFPLAAGSLILGAAMWGLAAAAMLGRRGARTALVQVILVHGLVVVLAYVATADVRTAATNADIQLALMQPEPKTAQLREARRLMRDYRHVMPLIATAMHLAGYSLLLLALTRRRTLEYFEAATPTRSEG
jgi:hypothetical protein